MEEEGLFGYPFNPHKATTTTADSHTNAHIRNEKPLQQISLSAFINAACRLADDKRYINFHQAEIGI